MYKAMTQNAPKYFSNLVSLHVPNRHLCSCSLGLTVIHWVKLASRGWGVPLNT